jgi:hypothetical protein
MTQDKQQTKTGLMGSKYVRLLLVLIMGLLLFGGPYAVFVFNNVLKVRFLISAAVGFGAALLGLLLMWYLIRAKIIT